MPHRAEIDRIEWLLIRVVHILITAHGVSPAAMRLNRMRPAVSAQRNRLREPVRDVASILRSHGMLRRRIARAA